MGYFLGQRLNKELNGSAEILGYCTSGRTAAPGDKCYLNDRNWEHVHNKMIEPDAILIDLGQNDAGQEYINKESIDTYAN